MARGVPCARRPRRPDRPSADRRDLHRPVRHRERRLTSGQTPRWRGDPLGSAVPSSAGWPAGPAMTTRESSKGPPSHPPALAGYLTFVVVLLGGWRGRASRRRPRPAPPRGRGERPCCGASCTIRASSPTSRVTASEVAVAFLVAAPLAISTGFLLGERVHLAEAFNPVVHFILAVPQSIFLPVFILAFGIGFLEKVLFGITHAYFVIVVNSFAAVRSVPRPLIAAARVFGATRTPDLYAHLPAGDAAADPHRTAAGHDLLHHRRAARRDVCLAPRHRSAHLHLGRGPTRCPS